VATRSPYNDRYKVDQKGKTRRSASASKPKRGIADLTPADSPKKKAASKRKWWSPAPAASTSPAFVATPEMGRLRRIWWVLWGLSLVVAVGILLLQNAAKQAADAASAVALAVSGATTATVEAAAAAAAAPYAPYVPLLWGLWAAAMAGAFYLEFVPIRKARAAAIEASRKGGKAAKADGGKPSKSDNAKAAKAAKEAGGVTGPDDK
jgi:hypothetical protein